MHPQCLCAFGAVSPVPRGSLGWYRPTLAGCTGRARISDRHQCGVRLEHGPKHLFLIFLIATIRSPYEAERAPRGWPAWFYLLLRHKRPSITERVKLSQLRI